MEGESLITKVTEINALQLLEKVDSFYRNAWIMLIVYITILIAFVGIVIPFLVQWVQKRFFILREDKIKMELKKYCDDMQKQIVNEVDKKLIGAFSSLEIKIKKESDGANAKVYHVQGNYNVSQKNYRAALESFLDSIPCYISAEDELNLQRVLKLIVSCSEGIYNEDLENMQHDGYSLEKTIKLLEEKNEHGRYGDYIVNIKKMLDAIKRKKKNG